MRSPHGSSAVPARITDVGDAPTHTGLVVSAGDILAGGLLADDDAAGGESTSGQLTAAQIDLIDVLAAEQPGRPRVPLLPHVAVQVGRRAGKTTSLIATGLARCLTWPGYRAVYCAQNGLVSVRRFDDARVALAAAAERAAGAGHDLFAPGRLTARLAQGKEGFLFGNGSSFRFAPPQPSTFRSDAYDLAIIDEAQEHSTADGAALLAAILPTMDTRRRAQLIVAGTAAMDRDRMLWAALERGRAGVPGWGIVEFAADPELDDLEDPAVWARVHPGVADGITPVDLLPSRRAELGDALFAAEYLGVWPEPASAGGLRRAWSASGSEHVARPDWYGVGFDVDLELDRTSVAVAWRDPTGTLRVELVGSRAGTSWAKPLIVALAARGITIGYDASSRGSLDLADELTKERVGGRRLTLQGLELLEWVTACSAFARHVVDDDVRHPRQPDLDRAVEVAVRRRVGDAGWCWGRRASGDDITQLAAVTVAARIAATTQPRARPRIRTATPTAA